MTSFLLQVLVAVAVNIYIIKLKGRIKELSKNCNGS